MSAGTGRRTDVSLAKRMWASSTVATVEFDDLRLRPMIAES